MSTGWIITSGVAFYILGFFFTLWVNLMSGPVTFGLALLRAAVWPYFWLTGRPEGQRMRMD